MKKFLVNDKVLCAQAYSFCGVGVLTLGIVIKCDEPLQTKVFFPSLGAWWLVPTEKLILLERKGVKKLTAMVFEPTNTGDRYSHTLNEDTR